MASLAAFSHPQIDLLPEQGAASDEIRTQVWGLLSTLHAKVSVMERRHETRYPFPYLIHLTPVGEDGATPCGENLVVVGKDVSERGLGFYHPQPLPYRRMIASLEGPRGALVRVPHRPEMVSLHPPRLVRKRWAVPRIGCFAHGGKRVAIIPAGTSPCCSIQVAKPKSICEARGRAPTTRRRNILNAVVPEPEFRQLLWGT